MNSSDIKHNKNARITCKKIKPSCEICEFYDYDDETGEKVCSISLDEDELARYVSGKDCPYFRYYDEYKSVNRQI